MTAALGPRRRQRIQGEAGERARLHKEPLWQSSEDTLAVSAAAAALLISRSHCIILKSARILKVCFSKQIFCTSSRVSKKERENEREREREREGCCVFSRCAMQMRLCILDPVRWIYCLHLLLPEEREGAKGGRERRREKEGSTYSSGLGLYSPFFF